MQNMHIRAGALTPACIPAGVGAADARWHDETHKALHVQQQARGPPAVSPAVRHA